MPDGSCGDGMRGAGGNNPPRGFADDEEAHDQEEEEGRTMKRMAWIMVIVLALAAAACGQQESTSKHTPITSKQVLKAAHHALEMALAYIEQQKAEYLGKTEAQLNRIAQRLEALQSKAGKVDEKGKAKLLEQISALKSKKDSARAQLEKLRAGDDQALENARSTLDAALDELEKEYDKILAALG
jgi:hypothetical protein